MAHKFKINGINYELKNNYYSWLVVDENDNGYGECIDFNYARTVVMKHLNKLGKSCLIFRVMI